MIEIDSIIKENPFPGLRPFKAEEADLFFGREEQVDELMRKIQKSHFVAVIGPSGCGKSSLVKAGLIPALRIGFLAEAGTRWRVTEMRPGEKPFDNLAGAILKTMKEGIHHEQIKAELKRCRKGLLEALRYHEFKPGENFLLIVDQFEELFRFKENNNIDEVIAFIDLLISAVQKDDTAAKDDVPLHIIITMRSDYLGECSLFQGLPEVLNDNQFLTPVLTREQTKEAIEGPAQVCGGYLEPQLVTTLLNDIEVGHDQLPLLQHTLMRMWNHVSENNSGSMQVSTNGLEVSGPLANKRRRIVLDSSVYAEVGKLSSSISNHANLIYDKLNSKQKKIAEAIFKRLTERNSEEKDTRRPTTVRDIAGVAGVSINEVITVADFFRDPDCSFLVPDTATSLTDNSYLDITHESIIRQWDKMRMWIAKEYESVSKFKRLIADADDYFNHKGEPLSGNDLDSALEWKSANYINKAWSMRYSAKLEDVESYINRSKRSELKKKIFRVSMLGGLVLAALIILSFVAKRNNDKKNQAIKELTLKQEQAVQSARYEEMGKQNAKIAAKNEEIGDQFTKIQQQKKEIDSANNALTQNLTVLDDQNQKLKRYKYLSDISGLRFFNKLDTTDQALAIKDLMPLFYSDDKKAIKSFSDKIDKVLEIKREMAQNTLEKFKEAKEMWKNDKSPVVASMLSKVINENLFYKQEINLSDDGYGTSYSFQMSGKKTSFSVNNGYDEISIGKYLNNSIDFDDTYTDKDDTLWFGEVSATAFSKAGIIGLDAGGKLFEWNRSGKNKFGTILNLDEYQPSVFSPDGRYLLSTHTTGSYEKFAGAKPRPVRLWDVEKLKRNEYVELYSDTTAGIRQAAFSADGSQAFILHNNGRFQIYEILKKANHVPVFSGIGNIISAAYLPNSNFIVILSELGYINVVNAEGKADFIRAQLTRSADQMTGVRSIEVSPDGKKVLLGFDNSLALYERANGDPVFYKEGSKKDDSLANKFLERKFNIGSVQANAYFINDNTIITADKRGSVRLWQIYPPFKNLNEAFDAIKVSNQASDENVLSNYYRLMGLATGQIKYTYGNKILTRNERVITKEELKDLPDHHMLARKYKENADVGEEILKGNIADKVKLSNIYWNLSWHLIFTKDYGDAAKSVERGMELNPLNDGMKTNLALSYLLRKKFNEAEAIYREYKGKTYSSRSRQFTESFLQDLADLEKEGIILPADTEIYREVTKIRAMLTAK